MAGDQEQTHRDRRRGYHALLSTIAHNVGDPQPPLVAAGQLWTTAVANGSLEHDDAESALRAARENGHVIRWTDGDGTVRYGLTEAGIDACPRIEGPVLSSADVGTLRVYIATEASRADPDRGFIGWANGRVSVL